MGKNKESNAKRKVTNAGRKFIEYINAFVGVIGIILASIAIIPTIQNWIEKPKISIVRQVVHVLDEKIMTDYKVENIGTAIANDIFIQVQTFEGDHVDLPFAVAYEKRTEDSINWEITIKSLAPDEFTQISIYSNQVERFLEIAREIKEKTGKIPNIMPNIVSIDYREGEWKDVIQEDSPDLEKYLESQLEAKLNQ